MDRETAPQMEREVGPRANTVWRRRGESFGQGWSFKTVQKPEKSPSFRAQQWARFPGPGFWPLFLRLKVLKPSSRMRLVRTHLRLAKRFLQLLCWGGLAIRATQRFAASVITRELWGCREKPCSIHGCMRESPTRLKPLPSRTKHSRTQC